MSRRRAKLIPDAAGDIVPLMFAQFGLSIADVNNTVPAACTVDLLATGCHSIESITRFGLCAWAVHCLRVLEVVHRCEND